MCLIFEQTTKTFIIIYRSFAVTGNWQTCGKGELGLNKRMGKELLTWHVQQVEGLHCNRKNRSNLQF